MVKHCKIKSVYCLFVLDLALNNECDEKDRAKYLAEMQVRREGRGGWGTLSCPNNDVLPLTLF